MGTAKRRAVLPRSWHTWQEPAFRPMWKWIADNIRGETVFWDMGGQFWCVRFTNERDKWHRNVIGQLVATKPRDRAFEIISAGYTIDECYWNLRRAHGVGKVVTYRPTNREWSEFETSDGAVIRRAADGTILAPSGKPARAS